MSAAAPTTPTPASRSGASMSTGAAGGYGHGHGPTSSSGPESMSELEREVLDEYGELLTNLNELAPLIADLATNPTAQVLDTLRVLERKASLVSTLLKASVYSIVLQQQMLEGEEHAQSQHQDARRGGGGGGGAGEVGEDSLAE